MTLRTFVTFRVGNQTFALPLNVVRQVVRLPALTPIAGAPSLIAGLLDFHGLLLPVLVGHHLLDQPLSVSLDSMVIILSTDDEQPRLGLLVDEVYGVQQAQPGDLAPLSLGSPVLSASLRSAEGVIPVLDPAALRV